MDNTERKKNIQINLSFARKHTYQSGNNNINNNSNSKSASTENNLNYTTANSNHINNVNNNTTQDLYDTKLDLVTIFEILIKMGFIKYNTDCDNESNSIFENEKKLVYLLWNLLKGD